MSKRNRYGSKGGRSSSVNDIINSERIRGRILRDKRSERLNIRIPPAVLAWLREQPNMSRYIVNLIVDDMIKRGGV